MKPKIVALILVRMGSSRFPGKALCDISGIPMLQLICSRVQRSEFIDEIVVCTSSNEENDAIESMCQAQGVHIFRGSEDNVSLRMYEALSYFNANVGVTIFGDCPLIEPRVIDLVISEFENGNFDFVGNNLKTTFPPGTEVEVFKKDALKKGIAICNDPTIYEHGTLVIRSNSGVFNIKNIEAPSELYRPEYEIEVDEIADILFIRKIAENFEDLINLKLEDIIYFLDNNQELIGINKLVNRRWKEYRND